MNEPLVDAEGFPRDDIDLYQVRTARHNIICEWGGSPAAGGGREAPSRLPGGQGSVPLQQERARKKRVVWEAYGLLLLE